MSAISDQILTYLKELNIGLNNISDAALYKKIVNAISPVIDNILAEQKNSETIITNIIGQQRYGQEDYYITKALAYQINSNLIPDPITLKPVYAIIDLTKLLVKVASFEPLASGGAEFLTLKIAKWNSINNKLVKLTDAEKADFDSYFLNFEIPGLPVYKVSNNPNIFDFSTYITYYSTYNFDNLKTAVNLAVYEFRNNFSLTSFNGVLYVNDLATYLKNNVLGIRNVYLTSTLIDSVSFSDYTKLSCGYFDFPDNILDKIFYNAI